jgi:hypothetical protein
MFNFPVVEFFDICDDIDLAPCMEGVSIVAEESRINNTSTVILLLEVRVCKTEKHLL